MSYCSASTTASMKSIPLAAASATDNNYLLDITQKLCQTTYINGAKPVFNVNVSVGKVTFVGNNAYNIEVVVSGTITYVPSGNCNCCSRTEMISTKVNIGAISATGIPTVTLTPSEIYATSLTPTSCNSVNSRQFNISTSVLVVVTPPSA